MAKTKTRRPLQVQEKAVSAIASIADRAGEHFAPFYDVFIPPLKQVFFKVAKPQPRGDGSGPSPRQRLEQECVQEEQDLGVRL